MKKLKRIWRELGLNYNMDSVLNIIKDGEKVQILAILLPLILFIHLNTNIYLQFSYAILLGIMFSYLHILFKTHSENKTLILKTKRKLRDLEYIPFPLFFGIITSIVWTLFFYSMYLALVNINQDLITKIILIIQIIIISTIFSAMRFFQHIGRKINEKKN